MTENSVLIQAMPFQKEDVRQMEKWGGRALNASEMGLGKTLETLWLLKRNPAWSPVVVICPAAVKYTWDRVARLPQFGHDPLILNGKKPTIDFKLLETAPAFVVINYNILMGWAPFLKLMQPQIVILDECQALQHRTSQQTKAVRWLCQGVPHVVGLSGTPMVNRPQGMFSILNIIAPHEFPNWQAFGHRYCDPRKKPWGWEFKGASNLPELHRRLRSSCMIRRLKKDVLHQLPKKVRSVVTLEMDDPKNDYPAARDQFLEWLTKQQPDRLATSGKAEFVTQLGYLRRLAAKLKSDAAIAWISKFLHENPTEKLVVYCIHTAFLDKICSHFGTIVSRVDGSVVSKKRQEAVDRFQADPYCRLFCANIIAGGTGIDGLQRVASSMAILEMDFRPAIQLQAESRISRIGQDEPSFIYYLIAANTIEERVAAINQTKQSVINNAIDGDNALDSFSILDDLMRELAPATTKFLRN